MTLALLLLIASPPPAPDHDMDGVADDQDNCVDTTNPSQANQDGDCMGDACDVDADGDGIGDDRDNCMAWFATDTSDDDQDGFGNACDVCPEVWDPDQADDGERRVGELPDGIGDACDPHADRGGDQRHEVFLNQPIPRFEGYVSVIRRYHAEWGDTWAKLAQRFRISVAELTRANANRLDRVDAGTIIDVPFARITPRGLVDGININVPERMLYLVGSGRLEALMPIAMTRCPAGLPEEKWSKHTGRVITGKREQVTCKMPKSIAELATQGCVRLMAEDASELFSRVPRDTHVAILYEDVKIEQTPEGRVLLEAHPDGCGAFLDALGRASMLIGDIAEERIDRAVIQRVLEDRDGRVTDVSRMCAARVGGVFAHVDEDGLRARRLNDARASD